MMKYSDYMLLVVVFTMFLISMNVSVLKRAVKNHTEMSITISSDIVNLNKNLNKKIEYMGMVIDGMQKRLDQKEGVGR